MMAGIPQICIDFPEYRSICANYPFAMLLANLEENTLKTAIQSMIHDTELRERLRSAALKARSDLNWEKESSILLKIYADIDG